MGPERHSVRLGRGAWIADVAAVPLGLLVTGRQALWWGMIIGGMALAIRDAKGFSHEG